MADHWHVPLRHIRGADLTGETNQTTGMTRFEAVSGKTVGSTKIWMGQTHVAPATASGDHHHGEAETAIFVVSGNPVFVFADGESEVRIQTEPGDYVFVPPYVPHREENPGTEEAVVVIGRSSQEGIVVNLPSLWAPVTPELTNLPRPLEVVEYTDPLCPWAWGSEPTFRRLREVLGAGVRWRRVFGILFDAGDDPPPDPDAETAWYHRQLAEISEHTGAPYPRVLERVALTSWPASLAAKAAQAQGDTVAQRVLRRLREQVFLLGVPPDTPDRVLDSVHGVSDLDHGRLADEAAASDVARAVAADRAETRRPVPEVRAIDDAGPHNGRAKPVDGGYRYALPTLLFTGAGGRMVVPGWRPLREYVDAARRVAPGCVHIAPLSDVDTALRRYRSLTVPELQSLTGTVLPPRDGVVVPTAAGPVWLHSDEAATHPATRVAER